MRSIRTAGLFLALTSALAALTSCAAEPVDSGDSHALLIEEPTYYVPETIWQMAPSGCEGRLVDEDLVLAFASGAPALAVVLDEHGQAVCVDTWESIELELERLMGDPSPDPMRPVWAGRSSD